MAREIELKLALPVSAQKALLRHPLFKQAEGKQSARVVNIYYDTEDLALQRHGVALRLRRIGRTWLQTVKCDAGIQAGLASRPEWESPYTDRFDFSGIDAPKVRNFLSRPAIRERIVPLFETSFLRTTWCFGGVLVMLDRGWVAAGDCREPISELELELAGGDFDQLFALAEGFAERVPLLPSVESKAERGYRLFSGESPMPCKGYGLSFDRKAYAKLSPLAVFRLHATACLSHLQRNQPYAINTDNPEFIHQMRVAVRRLRALFRVFRPLLPQAPFDELLPSFRMLMSRLGALRDLDVLRRETIQPVLRAWPDDSGLMALSGSLETGYVSVRREAEQFLLGAEYGLLLVRLLRLVHRLPEAGDGAVLTTFALNRLDRLRRRVRRLAKVAGPGEIEALHALRISVKRFRYALEFFAPLIRHPHRARVLKRLTQAQSLLGGLNDFHSAQRILAEYAGNRRVLLEGKALIVDWHAARQEKLRDRLPLLLIGLRRLPSLR